MGSGGAATGETIDPLAIRPPHFQLRAKYVIQILANGGPSQMDTFDPKPMLTKYHGFRLPFYLETVRLTYRFQGRDFRLTDVYGRVVRELIA
jgi:Protein of unknown function (DUF1501)